LRQLHLISCAKCSMLMCVALLQKANVRSPISESQCSKGRCITVFLGLCSKGLISGESGCFIYHKSTLKLLGILICIRRCCSESHQQKQLNLQCGQVIRFWWRQLAAGRSLKFASWQGGWGESSCLTTATAIHSVTFQLRDWHFATELSPSIQKDAKSLSKCLCVVELFKGAVSSSFEPVVTIHCLAVLDFRASVEQPFSCLIIENHQAMQQGWIERGLIGAIAPPKPPTVSFSP